MPSPAFSAGHSQEIKTKENAVISCLFYPSISCVISKVQCLRQKKGKTVTPWRVYKQRANCLPFREANSVIMPSISITKVG